MRMKAGSFELPTGWTAPSPLIPEEGSLAFAANIRARQFE